jgi:hypothetical protein
MSNFRNNIVAKFHKCCLYNNDDDDDDNGDDDNDDLPVSLSMKVLHSATPVVSRHRSNQIDIEST